MVLSLEILLMVRGKIFHVCILPSLISIWTCLSQVFALYDRKKWIAVFLGTVLGLKTTALIILRALTLGTITFGNACLVKRAPHTVVYIR